MAVAPATLPLSLIRGIEFSELVLQCRDESVTVTGTLNPDVTGTFVLSGTYNGFPLFILHGTPATFCYYNTAATSYILARTLSDGGLTDFWVLAPAATEPSGSYAPAGAYTGTATVTDNPVDLTGFDVQATVRRTENPESELYINLNPSITTPATGEITIPAISTATTAALEFIGNFKWDLVLTQGAQRFGPFIKGPFTVSDNITQS